MKIQRFFDLPFANHYGFVNLDTHGDTTLYIDFNFIRTMRNLDFNNQEAYEKIQDFFSFCYTSYRDDNREQALRNFEYVSEINELHLGLSHSDEPKGQAPSPEILNRVFEKMVRVDVAFNSPLPMFLFVYRFGPDYLSDLVSNIIFEELYDFTIKTLKRLNVPVTYGPGEEHNYWNMEKHSWEVKRTASILIEGKSMLLVPTAAVTKKYGFSTGDYVHRIIMTAIRQQRIQESDGHKVPSKTYLLQEILHRRYVGKGGLKRFALDATLEHPEFMDEYIRKFELFLNNNAEHLENDNDLPKKAIRKLKAA